MERLLQPRDPKNEIHVYVGDVLCGSVTLLLSVELLVWTSTRGVCWRCARTQFGADAHAARRWVWFKRRLCSNSSSILSTTIQHSPESSVVPLAIPDPVPSYPSNGADRAKNSSVSTQHLPSVSGDSSCIASSSRIMGGCNPTKEKEKRQKASPISRPGRVHLV